MMVVTPRAVIKSRVVTSLACVVTGIAEIKSWGGEIPVSSHGYHNGLFGGMR